MAVIRGNSRHGVHLPGDVYGGRREARSQIKVDSLLLQVGSMTRPLAFQPLASWSSFRGRRGRYHRIMLFDETPCLISQTAGAEIQRLSLS